MSKKVKETVAAEEPIVIYQDVEPSLIVDILAGVGGLAIAAAVIWLGIIVTTFILDTVNTNKQIKELSDRQTRIEAATGSGQFCEQRGPYVVCYNSSETTPSR